MDAPWRDGGLSGWLRDRLARTAREVAREWGIELGSELSFARYSYVAAVGNDAVLKVTPIEDDESDEEADALAHWRGDGAVRLLRHDPERRVLLLERARPGSDASTVLDDEAITAAVDVGRRLWKPVPSDGPFRWIGDHVPRWLDRAGGGGLVRRAREVYASMEVPRETLIHGDFHHHNLLRHGDRWVAIDPKPMAGEPEFDVPSFLWNPIGSLPTRERTERRIAAFVRAGLDEELIRQWTIVRGVYLGQPLSPGETEDTSPQIRTVRLLQ